MKFLLLAPSRWHPTENIITSVTDSCDVIQLKIHCRTGKYRPYIPGVIFLLSSEVKCTAFREAHGSFYFRNRTVFLCSVIAIHHTGSDVSMKEVWIEEKYVQYFHTLLCKGGYACTNSNSTMFCLRIQHGSQPIRTCIASWGDSSINQYKGRLVRHILSTKFWGKNFKLCFIRTLYD